MNLDVGSGGGPYHWRPRAEVCASLDIPHGHREEMIVKSDAQRLPFRDKMFQTVFAFNLLEHVENPWEVLRELRRVGLLVHVRQDTMFNLASYATPEHLWFQLPGLHFLPYPRTRVGIALSLRLRRFILGLKVHPVRLVLGRFMSPHQQYDVILA